MPLLAVLGEAMLCIRLEEFRLGKWRIFVMGYLLSLISCYAIGRLGMRDSDRPCMHDP